MSGIVGSRLNIRGSGVIGGLGTDGQVLTSAGAGQEIVFESVSSAAITAINNPTANELVSVGSTTTELDAEANLTFTGSALTCIGTVTVGVDNTGHDVKYFGATSGNYWLWDESADGVVQIGTLTVGVDNTGHDVKYFGATSGSYWLWDESADGVVQVGTLTVGVDDAGHDVKLFGNAAGAYMEWDASADELRIMGASADATTSTGKLLLATSLTDINANDVIGKIDFQAPHEAGGTDAITVAASIRAVAQATFSSSVNATDLVFYTGHSEAAAEKVRITSQNEIGIAGANYGTDGQVLTSGGAGAAVAWEDASGAVTALNNATANELVTVGSTTTELDAEAKLTFSSSTLTLGNGTAEDAAIIFDGNEGDFYIALDDSANYLRIGTGSTIGSSFGISIDNSTLETSFYGNIKAVGASATLTMGGAVDGQDTKIVFDGNAQDYHIGLDDSSDKLVIGLGSTLGTTSHMTFDATGAINKPLQPAFSVVPASVQASIATGSAITVVYGTEIFDQNGDFASNTFTAPVAGRYMFSTIIELYNIDSAAGTYDCVLNSSNRVYRVYFRADQMNADGHFDIPISCVADMDASDTMYITVNQASGTSQTNIGQRPFGGYLIC
jgi:hypothetical protein